MSVFYYRWEEALNLCSRVFYTPMNGLVQFLPEVAMVTNDAHSISNNKQKHIVHTLNFIMLIVLYVVCIFSITTSQLVLLQSWFWSIVKYNLTNIFSYSCLKCFDILKEIDILNLHLSIYLSIYLWKSSKINYHQTLSTILSLLLMVSYLDILSLYIFPFRYSRLPSTDVLQLQMLTVRIKISM